MRGRCPRHQERPDGVDGIDALEILRRQPVQLQFLAGDRIVDDAGDDLGIVEGFFEARPGARTLGFFTRQAGLAGTVLDGFKRDLHGVASFYFDLTTLVLELLHRDHGLGL